MGSVWFQEKQLRKIIDTRKVPGMVNPGDLLTKHFSRERIDCDTAMFNFKCIGGRASAAAGFHNLQSAGDSIPTERANSESKCWVRVSDTT